MFQILLAVIGILGSGAVWHFISSKQYHVAIWVGFSGFVLLFLVIALYLPTQRVAQSGGIFSYHCCSGKVL